MRIVRGGIPRAHCDKVVFEIRGRQRLAVPWKGRRPCYLQIQVTSPEKENCEPSGIWRGLKRLKPPPEGRLRYSFYTWQMSWARHLTFGNEWQASDAGVFHQPRTKDPG